VSCRACGGQIAGKASWAWYCARCSKVVKRIRRSAVNQVANAIQYQGFPHPGGFTCVDCQSWPAQFYDHRSYAEPLNVDPVCGSCNRARGPAAELINGIEHITLEAA
jgi:hypothetical protein